MAKHQVFDTETNEPVGELEIPDDVMEAAAKVEAWMKRHDAMVLHGLKLAED